jgi:N6-L-threonylcarbamoyladenine synthase
VVEVLVAKTFRAAQARNRKVISISGGVSTNACLRKAAGQAAEKAGVSLRFAPEGLRTDNALMIAYAAAHHLAAGHSHPCDTDIRPNFDPASICS